jgi:hypothetical protein
MDGALLSSHLYSVMFGNEVRGERGNYHIRVYFSFIQQRSSDAAWMFFGDVVLTREMVLKTQN